MLSARFDGALRVAETDTPTPAAGEALVRTRLAGICNTDIEITRGYMGFCGVLGHEFVGDVVQCDDAAWVGKRVVGDINIPCRRCPACSDGLGRHCPHRSVLGILNKDGAFAEYLTLPVANLHAVSDALDDRQAVFAEPLAAALEILEQVTIGAADSVLLIGDGKLSLLIAQVLRSTGCDLCVVGKHTAKLALLADLGIASVLLSDHTPKKHDIVVEASGAPSGLELAMASLHPRGTLVLKSTYAQVMQWNPAQLVIDEITLIGSRCGRIKDALHFFSRDPLHLEPMIDGCYPLVDARAAFEHARQPGALKVLLDPQRRT